MRNSSGRWSRNRQWPPGFFVDENDLALGKALREIHDDVVYPGHVELPEIPRGALDDEWLPVEQIIVAEPEGPWMHAVTTTGLRAIAL